MQKSSCRRIRRGQLGFKVHMALTLYTLTELRYHRITKMLDQLIRLDCGPVELFPKSVVPSTC